MDFNIQTLYNRKVMNAKLLSRSCLVSLALLVGLVAPCAAQSGAQAPYHFASLQLLHPVATSPDPETTTSFRLSVFYGRSGGIHGLDLNAVAGVTSGDVTALQMTGLYACTGGIFQGMSLTGGLSHLQNGGAGFQFSGLANYNEDAFAGLQMAGILNYTSRAFAGAQISSVMNLNDGAGTFLQASSVANVNAGPFAGVQMAVFLNVANARTGGGQLALLNYAESINGFQVGVLNLSHEFHGLQIGILNQSHEFSGTPIGLINMDDNSRKEWMFYGSNLSLLNIGFRTVLNNWSSVVSVGGSDVKGDVENSLFLGWNFGRNFPLSKRWDLTIDLGYQHIMPRKSDIPDENDHLHYSLQARALGTYHLNDSLGLIGSVGSSTVYSGYVSGADSETDFHFSAGIVLYR
jgi:hypothetical protein